MKEPKISVARARIFSDHFSGLTHQLLACCFWSEHENCASCGKADSTEHLVVDPTPSAAGLAASVPDTKIMPAAIMQIYWSWTHSSAALLCYICPGQWNCVSCCSAAGQSSWTWTSSSAALLSASGLDPKTESAVAVQSSWTWTNPSAAASVLDSGHDQGPRASQKGRASGRGLTYQLLCLLHIGHENSASFKRAELLDVDSAISCFARCICAEHKNDASCCRPELLVMDSPISCFDCCFCAGHENCDICCKAEVLDVDSAISCFC